MKLNNFTENNLADLVHFLDEIRTYFHKQNMSEKERLFLHKKYYQKSIIFIDLIYKSAPDSVRTLIDKAQH